MISDSTKSVAALGSLNAALVQLRRLAYNGADGAMLADLLDLVEYLPRLLADRRDRTEDFRHVLLDLVARESDFQIALERFDHPSTW